MSVSADAPQNDAEARAYIDRLAAQARVEVISSAAGSMVWRSWGAGPALVLLHGGSGSWTHWIHTIPAFMGDRQVLAADLPGLGDSADPRAPYDADSIAGIVADAIAQLLPGDVPVDLVGFSFGGITAGHVAALRRTPLHRLVIVGSPPFGLGSTGPTNEVRAVDPALSFERARDLHRHNLQLFMIADSRRVDPLALRIHHDNLRRSRLRSRKIARAGTLAQALRDSPCTPHGIWGAQDVTAHPDLESIRALFLARDGGGFDALPGVGHWAPYEAADEFNRLLRQHLDAPLLNHVSP